MTNQSDQARPILVTGAAGFVGSHVMRAMVSSGRRVVATDLAPQAPRAALAGLSMDRLRYISGDLRRPELIDALAAATGGQCDVVHVAALLQAAQFGRTLGESPPTPSDAVASLDVNATATWRLCADLAERAVLGRFLHVSTRSVFGGRPPTPDKIPEDALLQPAGLYGASKAAAELGLMALRDQFDINLVVARITGVFGPWQGPVSFIGQAMKAVLEGLPHRTATGGDEAFELTYVKDTVRGLALLVEAEHLNHSVYHVASGDRLVKLSEVAAAYRAADPSADVDFGPGVHPDSRRRTPLHVGWATTDVGFGTRWTLEQAIADYLKVERTGDYGSEAMAAEIEVG